MIILAADASRLKYMIDTLNTHQGLPHCITRSCIFEDGVELYRKKLQEILDEFPFRICYDQERAVDTGGVCRDFFQAFGSQSIRYPLMVVVLSFQQFMPKLTCHCFLY